jgi:hypothetical protein
MEQTKGYLRLKGKIWSLNNKEAIENSATKFLSFGLQTSKENSLFIQVGEWKNTTLNIKIKGEGMTEVEEVNEQDAISKIKELFKDGDSVFINTRAEVDTYRKSIKYLVNQIYIEKEPIDFDNKDFIETNELNQAVVITEKPSNRLVKVGVTTYKGEMIEQDLQLNDDDVNDYFEENAKVGDLMKLTISVNRRPNYVNQGEVSERKTLKGKSVKSGGKKIDGYNEFLEVVDVDLEKTEKQKYNRSDIREALDIVVNKAEKKVDTNNQVADIKSSITEDNLPF